jgi:hypothetical protein
MVTVATQHTICLQRNAHNLSWDFTYFRHVTYNDFSHQDRLIILGVRDPTEGPGEPSSGHDPGLGNLGSRTLT